MHDSKDEVITLNGHFCSKLYMISKKKYANYVQELSLIVCVLPRNMFKHSFVINCLQHTNIAH